jgi:hypothetical protein
MQDDESYKNKSFHLGKIDTNVIQLHHRNKYRRTYGWDCPYQDYKSNRHYNTQRHINLTHGYGSGEPVDHTTGETREEKRRASRESFERSKNGSMYRSSHPKFPVIKYPDTIAPSVIPNFIRMPYLKAQEVRVTELGFPIGAQPAIRYSPLPTGSAGWENVMNPHYRKNPSSDFVGNKTVPYLSNPYLMHERDNPLGASLTPINGPLAESIKSLVTYVTLRKCFR